MTDVWIFVAFVVGIALGWLVHSALAGARRDAGRERDRADAAQTKAELAKADAGVEQARGEAAEARRELAEAQTLLARQGALTAKADVERDAAREQADELRRDREAMLDRYKALSAEALDKQSKSVEQSAEQRLKATESLLAPMKQSLEQLQTRLGEMDRQRAGLTASMGEQVKAIQATGDQLRRETSALVSALRRPQVRGAWGELQLKRAVEIAGLVDHTDFVTQDATATDQGDIRPDLRVDLAGGKFVYVDAKTPLEAFLAASEATSESEQVAQLAHFVRHVRTHIDQLAGKAYWKAESGTPEFVVLFLPAEALASTALEQSPDLIEYAAAKNVILATPTTLIALLRTVSYAWSQQVLADSAREISQLGRDLYERLGTMGSYFDSLGRALSSSVTSYNKAMASLESRVLVAARRFRDLKVSEDDLDQPGLVEAPVRALTAVELTESAAEATPLIGRLPRAQADEVAPARALTS